MVAPGPIETALWHGTRRVIHDTAGGGAPADVMKSVLTGRMGTPDEVADAVLYFMSPQSAFVTG